MNRFTNGRAKAERRCWKQSSRQSIRQKRTTASALRYIHGATWKTHCRISFFSKESILMATVPTFIRNHKIASSYNLSCLQFCSEMNGKCYQVRFRCVIFLSLEPIFGSQGHQTKDPLVYHAFVPSIASEHLRTGAATASHNGRTKGV